MRPIRCLTLLCLAACSAGGGGFNTDTDISTDCSLAGPEYQPTTGSLVISELLVNGAAVVIDVTSTDVCKRADGNGAAWILESQGAQYGIVIAELQSAGPQALDGDLVFNFFGASPSQQFTGDDFFQGTWVANTFAPVGIAVQGQATTSVGNMLSINFTATAD